MKKLLLLAIAIVAVFSMVACGEKKQENNVTEPSITENENVIEEPVEEPVEEPTENPTEEIVEEQIGVGNTDESMVALALERYFMDAFKGSVEEVVPTSIKVYTKDEISKDEAIQSHNIGENDIVFDVTYDLKIAEGVEDMNQFTAANGEIDGQWIKNKSNIGIARDQGENGYTIDAFGTGF